MSRRTTGIARLVAASGISWAGDWALNIAASIEVFRRTDSTAAVSLLLALGAAPSIVLGPIAGAIADRHDRRKVMLIADLLSGLLLLAALPLLQTRADLLVIYACVLAVGVLSTFHRPASEALLPSLARPDQLSRANSALRLAQQFGFIGGPAAGAWLIDHRGLQMVFAIDAASFLVSSSIIAAIPRVRLAAAAALESPFRAALSGMSYAREHRRIRTVIGSLGVTMLVAPVVNAGTVVFVSDELHRSESIYGWLLTVQGVGAIAFATLLIVLGSRTRLLPTGIISLVVTGGAVLLLSVSGGLASAMAAMLVMGMGVVGLRVAFASYLQGEAADEYRGRVMSLVSIIANGGNLIGLALTPLAVVALGVRTAFALTGAIIALSAIPIILLNRSTVVSTVPGRAPEAVAAPDTTGRLR